MSDSFKIQQPEEIGTLEEAREYIKRLHEELDDTGVQLMNTEFALDVARSRAVNN